MKAASAAYDRGSPMAKRMMLSRGMYSDGRSQWSRLLSRKKSHGNLQPQKRKLAALSGPSKNSKGARGEESRIVVSASASNFAVHNGRRPRDRTQRKILLNQFRFQSFKKCFHMKCVTIIVPGDFKPCSPRRMFCSLECFEAHWKEKLSGNLWNAH